MKRLLLLAVLLPWVCLGQQSTLMPPGAVVKPGSSVGIVGSALNPNTPAGNNIYLYGNATVNATNINLTNSVLFGNGNTINLSYTNTDQILIFDNVTIRDTVITNVLDRNAEYLTLVRGTNVQIINSDLYSHEAVIGMDVSSGSSTPYNIRGLGSRFINIPLSNGPPAQPSGVGLCVTMKNNSEWDNCQFSCLAPTAGSPNLLVWTGASNSTNNFRGCLFTGLGGTNSCEGILDDGAASYSFQDCRFNFGPSDTPVTDAVNYLYDAIFLGTDIEGTASSISFNNCYFNLKAYPGRGWTKLAILLFQHTIEFNNCFYGPETNGVIIVNDACSLTVRGGNLKPYNFSSPQNVTWVNGSTIVKGGNAALALTATGTTLFEPLGAWGFAGAAASTTHHWRMPYTATLQNLFVQCDTGIGPSTNFSVYLFTNGTAVLGGGGALGAVIGPYVGTGTGTPFCISNKTFSVVVPQNTYCHIAFSNNAASAPAAQIMEWSLEAKQ